MNSYLIMWKLVNELDEDGINHWIRILAPATGKMVRFRDNMFLDIDFLSALYYRREEFEAHRQPNFD